MKRGIVSSRSTRRWGVVRLAALWIAAWAVGASAQQPYESAAQKARPGEYPEQLRGRQVYWTVVGAPDDTAESLLDEYGNLEPTAGGSTLMPYIFSGDKLISALDAASVRQELDRGYLPLPSVTWSLDALTQRIEAYAAGEPGSSATWIRYRLSNISDRPQSGRLFLAIRPVQVNPPWTFGGMSPIRALSFAGAPEKCDVQLDGVTRYVSLTPPDAFGAQAFDGGDVVQLLARGKVPEAKELKQEDGLLSGVLAYDFSLEPGTSKDVVVAAPLHPDGAPVAVSGGAEAFDGGLSAARARCEAQLAGAKVGPFGPDLDQAVKAQLAYILVNKDKDAFEPGTRHYGQSWIRDGSIMAAALLRAGMTEPVRKFADWYAQFITPEGEVPSRLDASAVPTSKIDIEPAWDGQGEYIYLVMEYYRSTRDRAFLERHFDRVMQALRFLEQLRKQTLAPDYMQGEPARERFVGILPKSFSHKGYRAQVHCYWDDLWALKGWKDGAAAAEAMERPELAKWAKEQYSQLRDSVRASIEAVIAHQHLDYVPASVEKADFDPTSTSIAFFPCGEEGVFPEAALKATYERYWKELAARDDPAWKGIFVTFEIRNAYAFLALGQKDRAQRVLDMIMKSRRPEGWQVLAAVFQGDARAPGYIGDMPHTWTGADLIIAADQLQAPAAKE